MNLPINAPPEPRRALTRTDGIRVPAIVAAAGEEAAQHFLNFFIASIRNRPPSGPTRARRCASLNGAKPTVAAS